MRISDWSSDVCSSDLQCLRLVAGRFPDPICRLALRVLREPAHRTNQPVFRLALPATYPSGAIEGYPPGLAGCRAYRPGPWQPATVRGIAAHTRRQPGHDVAGSFFPVYIRRLAVLGKTLPATLDRKSTRLNSSH